MENDDLRLIPGERNEIYQDDIPLESLLYTQKSQIKPTPLDITVLWAEGYHLTGQMKDAVVSILLNRINIAIYLDRVIEAELILKSELENAINNPARCGRILVSLILLFERIMPEKAKNYYTEAGKMISGNETLLDVYTRSIWKILKAGREVESNPQALRTNAFDLYEKKQFAEAEKIYRQMIALDFDLPGTYCHLARVQLMTGQTDEAEKSVTRAWELKDKAAGYVVPRIIFLQILLRMLKEQDISFWLKEITEELRKPYSVLDWHIQTLLENIMPRLTQENYQVLSALAEFLQSKKN